LHNHEGVAVAAVTQARAVEHGGQGQFRLYGAAERAGESGARDVGFEEDGGAALDAEFVEGRGERLGRDFEADGPLLRLRRAGAGQYCGGRRAAQQTRAKSR
jgi:hypothetical protein